jgi:tetratricopeptide (TPR) repeat protein
MSSGRPLICNHPVFSGDFLICPNEIPEFAHPRPRLPAIGLKELTECFPHMRMGKALIDEALFRLDAFMKFGVILIRLEAFGQEAEEWVKIRDITRLTVTASAVAAVCEKTFGMWGLVERDMFGCFLPEKDETRCVLLIEEIRSHAGKTGENCLSAGISIYPFARFSRIETIRNGRKALEHTRFLGAGSTAIFNALCLNLSGDRLYRQGEVKEAAEEYKTALMLEPGNMNLHNNLGVCYGVLGAFSSALEEFKTASMLDENAVMPVFNMGMIYTRMGETEKADQVFLHAKNLVPDDDELRIHIQKYCPDSGVMLENSPLERG